jgi:AraC-like DNA-binding protein
MDYIRHHPAAPLSEAVNYFYSLDGQMPHVHARIVPLPSFDLKINFGGAMRMYAPNSPDHAESFKHGWCVGMWSGHHAIDWPSDIQLIGVNLKPAGAWRLFNLPLYELHNQVITLDALWGSFATEVWERLAAAPTLLERFTLLEQLLLTRLDTTPDDAKPVQAAVSQIAQHHGDLSVRSLCEEIGFSQTHLSTLFKQRVGALPKELARLYRFEHALRSIDVSQPVDWPEIAYQCGFYDQAHFSKEFATFTGSTPTDYLKLRRQLCADNPEQHLLYRNLPAV